MRPHRYICTKEGEPVPCEDLMEWARWLETAEHRVVALSTVGDTEVSTVFLGLDHNFAGEGPPILWETMIFQPGYRHGRPQGLVDPATWAGPMDGKQWRYRSRAEAAAGHEAVVAALRDVFVEMPP